MLLAGVLPLDAQRLAVETFVDPTELGSTQIRDLAQDGSGRLVLATRSGIRTFDGSSFEGLPLTVQPRLDMAALEIDERGGFWFLPRWPPLRIFRGFPREGTSRIVHRTAVHRDAEMVDLMIHGDRVVVATVLHGLLVRDGESWRSVTAELSRDGLQIFDLERFGDRTAVATDRGLWFLEGLRLERARAPELAHAPILALGGDSNAETLMILLEDRILSLDTDGLHELVSGFHVPSLRGHLRRGALVRHGSHTIYFGSPNALYAFDTDRGSVIRLGVDQGLPAEGATALLVDHADQLWVGGDRGFSRVSRRFANFTSAEGLLEDEVSAALELPSGALLLGHNQGLSLLTEGGVETVGFPRDEGAPAPRDRIMEMTLGPEGAVWLAGVDKGLGRWWPERDLAEIQWIGPAQGLPGQVASVAVDRHGVVWTVSGDRLFRRADDGSWIELETGLDDETLVRRVTPGVSVPVFVLTGQGLGIPRGGSWLWKTTGDRERDYLYAVLEDREGTVWVGSAGGLLTLRDGRMELANLGGESLTRPVYSLLEGPEGNLWIGTDDGVFVWNGQDRDATGADGEPLDGLHHLTVRHGLAGHETNRGAFLVDRNGSVWIGTSLGLSRYDSRFDRDRRSIPPRVEISQIEVGGIPLPAGEAPALQAGDEEIGFRFRVVSLVREEEPALESRLVGLHPSWSSLGPGRVQEQRFANLEPGRYRFEVRARFRGGFWGQVASTETLVIPPPFWRTPEFGALAVALLLGIGATVLQWRHRRHRAIWCDALTGLPNRRSFDRRLAHELDCRADGSGPGPAVLFLGLDRFRLVTGSLGRNAGNELLVAVSRRLTTRLPRPAVLARMGTDEFAVLLPDVTDTGDAVARAEALQEAFVAPFVVGGQELFCSASIGVALETDPTRHPPDLLRDTEVAYLRAQATGPGNVVLFDPTMGDRVREELRREAELRRALEHGELRVVYQPILRLSTRELLAVEALVRWEHPIEGLVTPGTFLGIAEQSSLVQKIDAWVLETACAEFAEMARRGLLGTEPPALHVNLSPTQLVSQGLVADVSATKERWGLESNRLVLEITESYLLERSDATVRRLSDLRSAGVRICIDDFGAGHSSLGYLQDLPIDTLKLDRSFILRPGHGTEILRTLVELGRELGLLVIAEGVEREDQAEVLQALGCPAAQGFHFARPVSRCEIETAGSLEAIVIGGKAVPTAADTRAARPSEEGP